MRSAAVLALLGALSAISATDPRVQRAQIDTNKSARELMELERVWSWADAHADVATDLNILAADFYETDAHGRIRSRQQVLADLKAAKPASLSETPDDMNVRLYGDTAVVTGRFTRTQSGHVILGGRFTDVFVHRDGRWLAVSNHYSTAQSCQN